ncbi:cysM, partial [Symbiodinium pilosum]
EEADETARQLAIQEGIFAGVSSGGAVSAALKIAQEAPGRVVVCIVCDRGDRYLSTGVFAPPPPLHHSCISANLDLTLRSYQRNLKDQHAPIFALFTAPWCPDCMAALPVVDALFAERVRGGSLLRCIVSKTREEWKDASHPLRSDPRWRERPEAKGLVAVPTLAYLGTAAEPLAQPVIQGGLEGL